MLGDIEVQGHGGFHRILQHLLVQHRQGARQSADHRIDVGVGVVPEGGGSTGEDFALGTQLHVGFQADHGLPIGLRRGGARHLCLQLLSCWNPMEEWPG